MIDYFSLNFYPVVGMIFMLVFMWKNNSMEKKVTLKFYILTALICIELFIYNMELVLTHPDTNLMLLTLATACGYAVRPFLLILFIIIVLRDESRMNVKFPLMIPAILNVIFAFSTFFTHFTYCYDDHAVLQRGPLGWTAHIIMGIYLVVLIVVTFVKINKDNSFERIIVLEIVGILVIATLAESFFSNYWVLRVAITSALIFYFMYFQSRVFKDELISKHIQQNELTEKFSLQIITALASTVDAKDSYTNGHSQRVAIYAREISRRMGKSKEFQREIYYMGLLHDIGKIGIPDSIINKTGKLTDEEFAAIKAHPVIGADVLIRITTMPNLYVGALWHHERYDGRGYPDGLKGDDIPIYARIIAVADTYDAMTSQRSYRNAMSQQKVIDELERSKRTQLDPYIANIMLEMISEDVNYEMSEIKPDREPVHEKAANIKKPAVIEEVKSSSQITAPSAYEAEAIARAFSLQKEMETEIRRENYVSPEQLAAAQAAAMQISDEIIKPDYSSFSNDTIEKIEKARLADEEANVQEQNQNQKKNKPFIGKPFGKNKV